MNRNVKILAASRCCGFIFKPSVHICPNTTQLACDFVWLLCSPHGFPLTFLLFPIYNSKSLILACFAQ